MTVPVLTVDNLSVSFETEDKPVIAVDSVGFALEKGSTLGIVGESGCGKSVTALSIMRLLPKPAARIIQGTVRFGGEDLLSIPPDRLPHIRGKKISMIFQEPMTALNPVHSIGRQIIEVFDLHFPGMTAAGKFSSGVKMLERVGIADPSQVMEKYPHHLSGGMRQRVMIAMALTTRPDILIADEPTTALDVTVQAQILDLIRNLQQETRMAVILITHDLGVIAQNCDAAVVMYAGRVAERAGIRDLFARPSHPYTRGLLSSMPSQAGRAKTVLPTIRGQVPSLADMPGGCRFARRCPIASDQCLENNPPEVRIADGHFAACFYAGSGGDTGD